MALKMNKFEIAVHTNIVKIVLFLLIIVLVLNITYLHTDISLIAKNNSTQKNEIDRLQSKINMFENLLKINQANLNNIGSKLPLKMTYLPNKQPITLIAFSKQKEPVFARSRMDALISNFANEINGDEVIYITDYKTKLDIRNIKIIIRDSKDISTIKTPSIYIVNQNGVILSKFTIKNELSYEDLNFMKESLQIIFNQIKQ